MEPPVLAFLCAVQRADADSGDILGLLNENPAVRKRRIGFPTFGRT